MELVYFLADQRKNKQFLGRAGDPQDVGMAGVANFPSLRGRASPSVKSVGAVLLFALEEVTVLLLVPEEVTRSLLAPEEVTTSLLVPKVVTDSLTTRPTPGL